MKSDVVVIGGGPAGIASAYQASQQGVSVILVERDYRLGGILNQCIHNGFGLHYFGQEWTGPEYAQKWNEKLKKSPVQVLLNTLVYRIEKVGDKNIKVHIQSAEGLQTVQCSAVVLAMGCRERPAGAINLCGTRPAGIFSAGSTQQLINVHGKMVGKKIAILGSGDIGLIMARRLVCEGAEVVGVYEIMPTTSGLARNVTQCLQDFNIPLHLSTSVVRVEGEKRVTGIWIAPVREDFSFDLEKKQFVQCDTLLLSVGLLPESDLIESLGVEVSPVTNSALVNEFYQTSVPEIFMCGNVMHVNDLVDNVSWEGEHAGNSVAQFIKQGLPQEGKIEITHNERIRYTIPNYLYNNQQEVNVYFRVNKEYRKVAVVATSRGEQIAKAVHAVLRSGEMAHIKIDKSKIQKDLSITVQDL